MRRAITLLAFAAMMFPPSQAQQAAETDGRVTYFLIDASGSMAKDRKADEAESAVRKRLDEIQEIDPNALISRTYFRAENRDLCWHSIDIAQPVPASETVREFPKYGDDYTPLGAALESAILDAGSRPADIYILSDEVQSPNCGADICAVARQYLPLDNINVESIPIGRDAEVQDRLACVRASQLDSAAATSTAKESTGAGKNGALGGNDEEWEKAGWWERWLWLVIFFLGVGSAVSFAMRHGSKALAYERQSEHIQQLQRLLLTGEGKAEEHKAKISTLSKFKEPPKRAWLISGSVCAISAILSVSVLLFCDGSCFFLNLDSNDKFLWVKLDVARKLAWLVLSSDFSNAFAILGITPILFSFAQNWRYLQSKRTFAFVSGTAAEEEAKRQSAELDSLFDELKNVRANIEKTSIATPWAERPRNQFVSGRRRPSTFSDDDFANIEKVKSKLLEIAQGPIPTKVGESKDTLTAKIRKLKNYTPRSVWLPNWELGDLITDLNKEGAFKEAKDDWQTLANGIATRNTQTIKSALKSLANLTSS